MKNNQYIEKYGEKAMQLYNKKSSKQAVNHCNEQLSDGQLPDQSKKLSGRVFQKTNKSNSNKSLTRTSKSKSKIQISQNQNQYTFQKPLNFQNLSDKDKNRKKLVISGLSTPKNRSCKMGTGQEERVQSSSTKKKTADLRISQKLNDALYKSKTTKSIVKQLLQCLDMISQHECKINKWINQFKDIVYHIADQATVYRKKYKQQMLKNKKLQKEYQQINVNIKANCEKKRKPIEMIIMEQNQKLKEKIQKLQLKIQNFQKKEMILIETLQKLKQPLSSSVIEGSSTCKKQQYVVGNKIKKDFYGSLDEDEDQSQQQQSQENL